MSRAFKAIIEGFDEIKIALRILITPKIGLMKQLQKQMVFFRV